MEAGREDQWEYEAVGTTGSEEAGGGRMDGARRAVSPKQLWEQEL